VFYCEKDQAIIVDIEKHAVIYCSASVPDFQPPNLGITEDRRTFLDDHNLLTAEEPHQQTDETISDIRYRRRHHASHRAFVLFSGLRQVGIGLAAAVLTDGVGSLIGVTLVG